MPILIALGMGLAIVIFFVGLALRPAVNPVQARLSQYATRVRSLEEMELERPFRDRVVRPIIEGFARLVQRFTPRSNVEGLKQKLDMAGNPNDWTPSDFLGVRGLAALVCGAVPFLLMILAPKKELANIILMTAGGAAIGYYLPMMRVNNQIKARQKEIQQALPDALDLLTISVEAGLALPSAMAKVGEKWENELSRAFSRVIAEARVGKPMREALRDMADRAGVPDMTNFVVSLIQAEQLGVSMTKVLQIQSQQMRQKRRQRAEEEARKAPVKMSVVLVLLLIPGIFIVILGPTVPRIMRQFKIDPFKLIGLG